MKTQNTKNRKRKLIVKVVLAFIIGISFGFGVGKFLKSDTRLTSSIQKTLKQNCKCESVTMEERAVGVQFNKDDGFSNSKLNFTLKNCDYNSSAETEAQRLNTILKKEVENYESIDFISFYFKNEDKTEIIKINNGKIIPNQKS